MDKIIDGVDVSGCCCYENGKCLWTKRYYENNIAPDCEKVKNCYYKQLQRLKEELRTERIYSSQIEELEESLQHAKAENKELSESIKRLKEELNNYKTSKENSYQNLQKEWQQLQWDIRKLTTENERLKEEKSKLLSKCIDKQCRINELQQICAIKEFSLKVNGKEYKNLSGIDKAKLFINNENAIRDRYIQKLENKMTDLQCKFYENCKKVVDTQKQIDKYRQALQEIRCVVDKNISFMDTSSTTKAMIRIQDKINSVIGAE